METPIYQEHQKISRALMAFVLLIVAGCVVLSVVMTKGERIFDTIFLVIMGIAISLLLMSMTMRVVITTTELRFGFPFWRVRLPLETIEIIGVEPIPLLAGIGIHFSRGRWVYNARQGDGVHLVVAGKKHYLIGSDYAQALFNALKQATIKH
jgi:ABC-type Fe3+-siderophore transport system permease subunit